MFIRLLPKLLDKSNVLYARGCKRKTSFGLKNEMAANFLSFSMGEKPLTICLPSMRHNVKLARGFEVYQANSNIPIAHEVQSLNSFSGHSSNKINDSAEKCTIYRTTEWQKGQQPHIF